jgi:hypothetical protein
MNQQNMEWAISPIVVFHGVQTCSDVYSMSFPGFFFADLVPPLSVFETHNIFGFHVGLSWIRNVPHINPATGSAEYSRGFAKLDLALLERLPLQRKHNALKHSACFLEKGFVIGIRPIDWNLSHHQQLAPDSFRGFGSHHFEPSKQLKYEKTCTRVTKSG